MLQAANSGPTVAGGSTSNDQNKLSTANSAIAYAPEGILDRYGVNSVVVANSRGLLHKTTFSETGKTSVARDIKKQNHGKGQINHEIPASPNKKRCL